MYIVLFQRLRCGGPNGAHLALAQVAERSIFDAEFTRDSGEVHHLNGSGEQRNVEGAGGEAAGGFAQRLDVLRLVAAGKSNQLIAAELVISERTVERHMSNIFGKLGVDSRGELADLAREAGLLDATGS